jgi:L-lactate permease
VIDAIDEAGLGFNPVTGTGAALHMLGALGAYGKMGVTCIADSLAEADVLYDAVVATCRAIGRD